MFDVAKVPLDTIEESLDSTVDPEVAEMEANKTSTLATQPVAIINDPAISLVHHDPSITIVSGGGGEPAPQVPMDPAIYSFK